MSLDNINLDAVKAKVLAAYKIDDVLLKKFRGFAKRLKDKVKPLRTYSVNAVSFVSADGGDNRLSFNPAIVELVRVVDSRGNECALDAVPGSVTLSDLEARAQSASESKVEPLVRLCNDLGGKKLAELSYLLKGLNKLGKTTGAIRCYRDIVEWAVLYDLITNPALRWGGDTILVRDGLLRTKSFSRDIFPEIDKRLRAGIAEHGKKNVALSLVGVAKQSAVLSRLALALELEGTFYRDVSCYVQVDQDIEEECYNFERTWLDTFETTEEVDDTGKKFYQALGRMFLVKFGDRPMDPVWPVDIAEWQVGNAERILGQLTVDAQGGFPIPNYPMCIQKAHDFAKMTGLEIDVLQDLLIQGASVGFTPEEQDKLLRVVYLSKSLANLRYREA